MPSKEEGMPPRGPSKTGYNPADWFWESRKKGPEQSGTLVFNALRTLDVPFQYWLLSSGAAASLLRGLGATVVAPPIVRPASTILGLSPYHAIIVGLATGSSLKQIYWKTFIGDTVMPIGFSTMICVYNTLLNTFNTFLALWAVTSQQPAKQSCPYSFFTTAPLSISVGLGLYAVGLFVEWYCEVQRSAFKAKPENKGKPYSDGLFGLARNINYGGYTLWRIGYSLTCGGWVWAGLQAAWLAGDFCGRAIPSLDTYCEKRYGAQWDQVRAKVPYRLLPWIW